MKHRNIPNRMQNAEHRAQKGVFLPSALCVLTLLSGCSPQSMFYYPNKHLYADPAAMGLKYETLQYPSLNGKMLWGILIKTDQPPKGTVVHFHGNFGNLSNHFPLVLFLVRSGFDVLAFDYEGYGDSKGHPTPKNVTDDGIATIRYAQAHLRNPKTGVVVFGQSLGGATAIVSAAQAPEVKAAVIEAAFTSYHQMGKEALQRSAWTWLFSFLAPILVSHSSDPINYVDRISPRPIYFIHGDADKTVPVHMSRDLYAKAREPKKIWIIEGMGHLEGHRAGKKYETEIVNFFTQALATGKSGS